MLVVVFFISGYKISYSQDAQAIILLNNSSIEYQLEEVCYTIDILNTGATDFRLAGQNIRLYYDSGIFELLPNRLISLLPSPKYSDVALVQSVEHLNASGVGNLDYDSDLGFLNFFIDLNEIVDGGIVIPNDGNLFSFAEMCFTTTTGGSDAFCPSLTLARSELTMDYANAFIEMSEWISPSMQRSIELIGFDDIESTNPDECIDLIENTLEDCTDEIDNDGDGLVDCLDISCNDIGIICETDMLTCSDGIDNDGDGDVDCDDMSCGAPVLIDINPENVEDCITLADGVISIEASGLNLGYSIDGGEVFISTNLFENLGIGEYNIVVINSLTGCEVAYSNNPVIIENDCVELFESDCSDGIDNDLNGLIDCEDLYCFNIEDVLIEVDSSCIEEATGSIFISNLNPSYIVSINNGEILSNGQDLFDLASGVYIIEIRSTVYGCSYEWPNVIIIPSKDCDEDNEELVEICNDGIDNDGDGAIDCEDDECYLFSDCNSSEIYIPNIFSPFNLDGVNDQLILGINISKIRSIDRVQIFDRWGNLLIEKERIEVDSEISVWDGRVGGEKVVSGVYTILLIATNTDGKVIKRVSTVTML